MFLILHCHTLFIFVGSYRQASKLRVCQNGHAANEWCNVTFCVLKELSLIAERSSTSCVPHGMHVTVRSGALQVTRRVCATRKRCGFPCKVAKMSAALNGIGVSRSVMDLNPNLFLLL